MSANHLAHHQRLPLAVERLEERILLDSTSGRLAAGVNFRTWETAVYQDVLGRNPDATGDATWSSQYQARATLGRIGLAITQSNEAHVRVVTKDYTALLHRLPDQAGLAEFTLWLNQGGSASYVAGEILGSDEFFQQLGRSNTAFLTALYQKALCRPVDPTGAAAWGAALASGVARSVVADAVLNSPEGYAAQVDLLYQQLLHRPADADGLQVFTQALEQGDNLDQISATLVAAAEYQARLTVSASSSNSTGADTVTVQALTGEPITLSSAGHPLKDVSVQPPPAGTANAAQYPWGLLSFTVTGVSPGGNAIVTVTLPADDQPHTYVKEDSSGQLTPFLFDGVTRAELHGNTIILHLQDGGAGDSDGSVNGQIVDPGGPGHPPPPAGGGGGSSVAPPILPLLYENTTDDPARELINASTGSQGGDPMSYSYSSTGVRYADGALSFSAPLLASAGYSAPWGDTLSWSNNPGYAPTNVSGTGFMTSQLPFLEQTNSGNTIVAVTSGTNARYFDYASSVYTERAFLQDTLTHNTTTHQFVLTDNTGQTLTFDDFTSNWATALQGSFVSLVDQYGNSTSVTSYTGSNQIQEEQSTYTVGGTTESESYYYSYLTSGVNSGLLQNVLLRRKLGSGSWGSVRQVAYAYYDGTQTYGGISGELMTATVENAGGTALGTWYFRYYTTQPSGFPGAPQFVFDPASYAGLVAAVGTPSSATDSSVQPYAAFQFLYNSSHQISSIDVKATGASSGDSLGSGVGGFSYTYSTNGGSDGTTNSWKYKTVETLPDSNTNTVYTNALGEVMLQVYTDTGSSTGWETFYKCDSAGRLIEKAEPSAVTGYNDAYNDLLHYSSGSYQYLSNSSGLIELTDYYTSTTATSSTAGGVTGNIQDTKLEQGQTGTAILQEQWQYYRQTATVNGVSVSATPLASDEVFRNTDGTGGETTSYAYTWYSSTVRIQSVTATMPIITTSENGPGGSGADTQVTFFDILGRAQWLKDGDGYLQYLSYDQASGGLIKHIVDVNTSDTGDFSNLPSGWITPSGGGLELITQYVVDGLGRTTQETDPNANVTYTVFDDPDHEVRMYPGWNSSTHLPTGPTQFYREDWTHGYIETLTMSATPHVTGGVPDGTEAVASLQTLVRDYYTSGSQKVAEDRYFYLTGVTYSTSTYIGTLNTNYYEANYGYDARGWLCLDVSPTGTITRTVHDGQDRTLSIWVGTNDSSRQFYA